MPRFAIAFHTPGPNSDYPAHYDLFLQIDDMLSSWRLLEMFSAQKSTYEAVLTSPHRLSYLHFEGELSGNRGTLKQVMHGTISYELVSASQIKACLCGLQTRFALSLQQTENPPNWKIDLWDWKSPPHCPERPSPLPN